MFVSRLLTGRFDKAIAGLTVNFRESIEVNEDEEEEEEEVTLVFSFTVAGGLEDELTVR